MTSEFVRKTIIRAEVTRAAFQTRAELVVKMERMLENLKAAHVDNKSGIAYVQTQIKDTKHLLNFHNMKLGMLVEGSIRRMVMLKKGDEWGQSFAIQSASDAIRYIATLTEQGDAWIKGANAAIVDLLRMPVGVSLHCLYTLVDRFRDIYSGWFRYLPISSGHRPRRNGRNAANTLERILS
jgi:hypothetical protein